MRGIVSRALEKLCKCDATLVPAFNFSVATKKKPNYRWFTLTKDPWDPVNIN